MVGLSARFATAENVKIFYLALCARENLELDLWASLYETQNASHLFKDGMRKQPTLRDATTGFTDEMTTDEQTQKLNTDECHYPG